MATDSGTYTPETLARRAKIAEQLIAPSKQPIYSWLQGLSEVGQGALGGYQLKKTEDMEKSARKEAIAEALAAINGGQSSPQATSPATPATGPVSGAEPPSYGNAIAGIESGGKYDATGPVTRSGDKAYGKYQVMGANIGPWSKEALGREVTPQEFIADPKIQDAVFQHRFNQYVQKYGPEGAAKAWFAGEKGMNNPNATDQLGTTVQSFADRFTNSIGPQEPYKVAGPPMPPPTSPVAAALNAPAQQPQNPSAAPQPVNNRVAAALLNPWTPPAIQGALAKQLAPTEYGFQTLPDGTIIRTNPRTGQVEPTYKAPGKPTWGIIGEDQFGNKQYGWIDPFNQTTRPGSPTAQPGAPSPAGTPPVAPGGPPTPPTAAPVTITGPDGKPIEVPAGQDPKKFREHVTAATADAKVGKMTEVQANATQFANRMEDAERTVQEVGNEGTSLKGKLGEQVPIVGNYVQSKEYQKFAQAKSQFITALLRKESGAAINADEFTRYDREFFPQPGDGPEVIAQKSNARKVAIDAMKKGAGPVYGSPASPSATTTGEKKSIGGKNYFKKDGQWFEE